MKAETINVGGTTIHSFPVPVRWRWYSGSALRPRLGRTAHRTRLPVALVAKVAHAADEQLPRHERHRNRLSQREKQSSK